MTAITRQSAKIFAQNAPVGQVTAFRTTESTPQTTKAPDQIQNENYLQGWLNADGSGNVLPYAEDMNGLFYTLSYNTAYLYEKGIPEYSSTQTYYLNSFCQYSGKIYRCKGDSVINIAPTNTNYWDALPSSSYTATTVGAGTTNYGTVYAGTDTAGTQFQFKTIIGGSNVTISETADSLTISSTGGGGGTTITANSPLNLTNNVLSIQAATSSQGGYLTAADWTSFNSKLSSTIFSSANTWAAKNIFSSDVEISSVYTSRIKTKYDSSYGSHINHYYTDDNNTETLWLVDGYDNSFANLGLIPSVNNATLGTATSSWNSGYINSLYINNLNGPINTTSLTSNASIVPGASTLNLGSMASPWLYGYIKRHQLTSNGVAIEPTSDDYGMQLEWIGTKTRILYLADEAIYTNSNSEVSLGDSTHIFANGYFNKVLSSEINTGSSDLTLSSTDALYVVPNQGSGNAYLGNSSHYWYSLYIRGFNFQNGNVSFNGAAGADMSILPNPPSGYSSYLGTSSYSWTGGYITTIHGNRINLRTGTTTRASMYVLDDGRFIIERTSDYGTTKTLLVRNRSAGVQLSDGATSWASASDIRLKENIEPIQSALDEILHLNPVKYSLKEHHLSCADRAGFIAQEVQPYIPEVVTGTESEDEYLGLTYTEMIPFMVKAIQELSAKVDNLENQLMELKK